MERRAIRDHHGISDPELRFPPACVSLIPVGVEVQPSRNPAKFNHSSGWEVSRRYPDDAERVYVVLSREGGMTSLGLPTQETVTQVSPEPRCRLGLPIRVGVDRHS